jgi:hypothetical protein
MKANTAKAFIRGIDSNRIIFSASCSTMMNSKIIILFFYLFFIFFVFLRYSVEGDGDVLSDSGARKTRYAEGALLQIAL